MATLGVENTLGYYSAEELQAAGLQVGPGSKISRSVEFIGVEHIKIGKNVRIDGGVFISAGESGVHIGDYSHIARGVCIFGASARVRIGRFVGISPQTTLLTSTDSFDKPVICVPTVPDKFRSVRSGELTLNDLSMIGANSVILPGAWLGYGSVVAACSVLAYGETVPESAIVGGCPAKKVIGTRSTFELRSKVQRFLKEAKEQA